jgi:hypothetical protein
MSMANVPAVIDTGLARFIAGGVSIIAASRNAANRPELVRAQGCRVARDRRRIGVFLMSDQAQGLLADIRQNGRIAVVFTEPSTHRSLQIKGDDAAVARLHPGDAARVDAYRNAMVVQLAKVGVSEAVARALLGPSGSLVVVEFTPVAAFVQTPGPDAGKPVGAAP